MTIHVGSDGLGNRKYMSEIGRSIFVWWRAYSDELDHGMFDTHFGIGRKIETAGGVIVIHQSRQSGLKNRNLAPLKPLNLLCINIDANYIVAGFRENSRLHQADIAGAEDRHFQLPIPQLVRVAPAVGSHDEAVKLEEADFVAATVPIWSSAINNCKRQLLL